MNLLVAAEVTGFDLTTIMTGAVDTVKGDALTVLAIVVPALVIVVGASVGVKFGLKWLRQFSKS